MTLVREAAVNPTPASTIRWWSDGQPALSLSKGPARPGYVGADAQICISELGRDGMAKISSSRLRRFLEKVRRLWRREPELPGDPYAYRMAPVRRGPRGKSGAAAVAEPEEECGLFAGRG